MMPRTMPRTDLQLTPANMALAIIATVHIRNALKALRPGEPSRVAPELLVQHAEANLAIVERALAVRP